MEAPASTLFWCQQESQQNHMRFCQRTLCHTHLVMSLLAWEFHFCEKSQSSLSGWPWCSPYLKITFFFCLCILTNQGFCVNMEFANFAFENFGTNFSVNLTDYLQKIFFENIFFNILRPLSILPIFVKIQLDRISLLKNLQKTHFLSIYFPIFAFFSFLSGSLNF